MSRKPTPFPDLPQAPNPEEAEIRVDLSGLEKLPALDRLDRALRDAGRTGAISLYVAFPPARPGEGETLFQPVARMLKMEKLKGRVASAVPLVTPESAGIFVRMRT